MANRGGFASGLALGAIAGLAVGLLATPRTGRENRRTLRKSARALPELAEDLTSSAQLQADRAAGLAKQRCKIVLARLRQAAIVGLAVTRQEFQVARETPASEPLEFSSPTGTTTSAKRS